MKKAALLMAMAVTTAGIAFASGADEAQPEALRSAETFRGVDSVIVDAGAFDVEVTAGPDDSVLVRPGAGQDGFFGEPRARVYRQKSGSRLRIQVRGDTAFGPGTGVLRLRVPRDVDLRVATRSGRISVQGLDDGECVLSTTSGRLLLRDVRDSLSLDSVSGEITLDSIEGGLHAKTVSGSIRGRRVTFTDRSELSAVSGSIDISVDNSLEDLSFDLSSVSGRIVIGSIRAERGLRMGFGDTAVKGHTVSGSLVFRE
jgi:hypothetical protein